MKGPIGFIKGNFSSGLGIMGDIKEHIRAIIVDDEMPARENLRMMLADFCPEVAVVGMADGVDSAEKLFQQTHPDVVFLDIRMPSGAEGFDLIERLKNEMFYVVFVTAFKDHAIRAFDSRALHYILKPIDEGDLIETVDRLLQRRKLDARDDTGRQDYQESLRRLELEIARQSRLKRITINHSKGIKIIDPTDLSHLEGKGNCALLHFKTGETYLDTRTLKTYDDLLPDTFFRIHKSFIVNLTEVAEILHGDEQSAVLKSGLALPVSRERKKDMLRELQRLIG